MYRAAHTYRSWMMRNNMFLTFDSHRPRIRKKTRLSQPSTQLATSGRDRFRVRAVSRWPAREAGIAARSVARNRRCSLKTLHPVDWAVIKEVFWDPARVVCVRTPTKLNFHDGHGKKTPGLITFFIHSLLSKIQWVRDEQWSKGTALRSRAHQIPSKNRCDHQISRDSRGGSVPARR
jgi:hypothetical protein